MYRRNILGSEISAKNVENTETAEGSSKETGDIILRAREEYGRYFGICGSYHHLKACLCKYCPACPGDKGMFCARGGVAIVEEKKEGCLCETCELFKKFRLEGECFCQLKKKTDVPRRRPVHPDICTDFQTSAGTIRVCVLGEQNMRSK